MKTFKIFSTAALALMMAACSSEDTALNNSPAQQQGRKVHFTATIAAPGGNAGTRTEYTEVTEGDAAGTINVAWKAGDEIALIHNDTKDEVKVETVNTDGSATITGDITVGTNGETVTAYYPAAAIELNNDKNPVPVAAYTANLLAQDGTLKFIQDKLDTRMGEGKLKVDGDKATLAANVTLDSQIAIWKLSLLDGESNVLQATQVKIKGGESVLASTTTLTAGTSVVTLAIPTDVDIDGALTIEATVGSDTYAYTKEEGVKFDSKYYQSKVTMEKKAANAYLKWDNTKKELVTTDIPAEVTTVANADADVNWDAGTYVVEGDVTIGGTIALLGNVDLIIKDGAKLTVNNYIVGYTNYNLSIFGQSKQTGELVVNFSLDAIEGIKTLEVHSAKVKATSSGNNCCGFLNIQTFNVYGGSVDAESTGTNGYGIRLASSGSMNIYGGDVKALGKGNKFGIAGSHTTVTVSGGKLWAGCADNKAIDASNVTLTKDAGYTSGKIQYSMDKSDWSETVDASAKYVRVGY